MDRWDPVTDDGVIMRGRSYLIGGVALAAVLLQVPLPGAPPQPKPAPKAQAGATKCDRTLSPHGRTTIAQAVHAKRRISILCLRGGVYRTSDVFLRRHGMTITSVPGERATWRGRVIVRARNVTLEHINLDGTARRGSGSLPNPTINGSGFTLRDADVVNRTGICVHPATYRGLTPRRFMIERNRIHDCGRRPPTNLDHGIYVATGTGVVRWNAVFDNADRGVQLYPRAHGVRVYENTIDGNGEGIIFANDSTGNVAANNLITNSRVRWNVETFDLRGRGNKVVSNCVQPESESGWYSGRGGIAPGVKRSLTLRGNARADVVYANRGAGDLRIESLSPFCAGMGAPDDVTAPPGG